MAQARVFIDGQAGTTGLQLTERLCEHPHIELIEIDAAERKAPTARARCMAQADVCVLCLPDEAVDEAVALAGTTRLLDASSRHRTQAGWHYGLPELSAAQRQGLRTAQRVSNPGCYPQGFILLLRPLIEAGWLAAEEPIAIHALSGYSGGGRGLIERYEANREGLPIPPRPYALNQGHKHLAEMQCYSGLSNAPLFSPIVGDYAQGMLVHVPLLRGQLRGPAPARAAAREALEAFYRERYADEALLRVVSIDDEDPRDGGFLDPAALRNRDLLELMVFGDSEHLLLTARLDNLGKGAAGAAVQNLNLMLGYEETTALRLADV